MTIQTTIHDDGIYTNTLTTHSPTITQLPYVNFTFDCMKI